MSDEPKTYTDRDIVLELFPATDASLVPYRSKYSLTKSGLGNVLVLRSTGEELLELTPISSAGRATTVLCCDFCQHSAPRNFFHHVRASVPASKGRKFVYVSLCRNTHNCELRRLDDAPVEKLLERVGVS